MNSRQQLRNALQEAERLAPLVVNKEVDLLPARSPRRGTTLIDWVNSSLNLYDLIQAQYSVVALRKTRNGWSGWCPFHDDEAVQADGKAGTPSLFVVEDRRYGWSWRCYSTNCGAYMERMHHTFDWVLWSVGCDMDQALACAAQMREESG